MYLTYKFTLVKQWTPANSKRVAMQQPKLMSRNQSSAVAYLTFGKSVRESKLIVESVSTVVIPSEKTQLMINSVSITLQVDLLQMYLFICTIRGCYKTRVCNCIRCMDKGSSIIIIIIISYLVPHGRQSPRDGSKMIPSSAPQSARTARKPTGRFFDGQFHLKIT